MSRSGSRSRSDGRSPLFAEQSRSRVADRTPRTPTPSRSSPAATRNRSSSRLTVFLMMVSLPLRLPGERRARAGAGTRGRTTQHSWGRDHSARRSSARHSPWPASNPLVTICRRDLPPLGFDRAGGRVADAGDLELAPVRPTRGVHRRDRRTTGRRAPEGLGGCRPVDCRQLRPARRSRARKYLRADRPLCRLLGARRA
jgi:hypothetical protein